MNRSLTRGLIVAGAALVLGAINYSIHGKEHIKEHGEVIYLALAPVDPRSLMQGDYMALRFAIADDIDLSRRTDNTIALTLDANRVAHLDRNGWADGLRMRYRVRNGQPWLGTNAFFFEEGSAERFTPARYAEFRIDPHSGEAVLVGLRDGNFQPL